MSNECEHEYENLMYEGKNCTKCNNKENMKENKMNIILMFEMFDKEIKKRDNLIFTSEESKWYTRLERAVEKLIKEIDD